MVLSLFKKKKPVAKKMNGVNYEFHFKNKLTMEQRKRIDAHLNHKCTTCGAKLVQIKGHKWEHQCGCGKRFRYHTSVLRKS